MDGGQSLPASPWPGPRGPSWAHVGSGPNHRKWAQMGRESTVWPETWSRSMPGLCRSLWDGSNPLQGAVPGLILEVQVGSTMSVRAQIIENGPNRVQNRPFGAKQRPNESYGLSRPIRTTPEVKNGQKTQFLRKTAPGGRPAAPSDPVS